MSRAAAYTEIASLLERASRRINQAQIVYRQMQGDDHYGMQTLYGELSELCADFLFEAEARNAE